MKPFTHFLQVITLATWLSVVVFAVAAWVIGDQEAKLDITVGTSNGGVIEDVSLGEMNSAGNEGGMSEAPAQRLQSPPAMPELVKLSSLPDIPDVSPRQKPSKTDNSQPKQVAGGSSTSTRPKSSNRGSGGDAGQGEAAAAARMARGTMPPPRYPSEARRRGQEGTVLVEFVVDASGRVISATIVDPSPWPTLNQEAIRSVRRWKFPAGGVMKKQVPIVFKLR